MAGFNDRLIEIAKDAEAIVVFKRDAKGQLLMTPIISGADHMTVPKMISQVLEYSDGLKHFADDVTRRVMKHNGQEN